MTELINTIIQGDCIEVMKRIPGNSIDCIVTDPPYELGFMCKSWDRSGIAFKVDVWRECLRVLKPGGHLLAFGGSRTHHRIWCAIEDAGFEIRDEISWVYGSGFPKSLDVSKAIDKMAGENRPTVPGGVGSDAGYSGGFTPGRAYSNEPITAAAAWKGWGTALKPAFEPICLARKPLDGTVAANVLKWGTGGINVDVCRVGTDTTTTIRNGDSGGNGAYGRDERIFQRVNPPGRFPANFIHDGSEEVVAGFPQTGLSVASFRGLQHSGRHGGIGDLGDNLKDGTDTVRGYDDNGGSAARFFYCAKADRSERDAGVYGQPQRHADRVTDDGPGGDNPRNRTNNAQRNFHPTVKPIALMRYLCRLVCPPGGIVLDCFAGSGTTCIAARQEGFNFVGIDKDVEYCRIAEDRLNNTPEPLL